jgi:hypothetical protein
MRELRQLAESPIAHYLGMSAQPLRADRQKGESLASLHNPAVTASGLEQQRTTERTNQINEAGSQGKLSQAWATQLEQHLRAMVAHMVSAKRNRGLAKVPLALAKPPEASAWRKEDGKSRPGYR